MKVNSKYMRTVEPTKLRGWDEGDFHRGTASRVEHWRTDKIFPGSQGAEEHPFYSEMCKAMMM